MPVIRETRRRHYLEEHLMQDDLWEWAREHHTILRGLSPDELHQLREIATIFAHEKEFEGTDGLVITEKVKASVAVQAALPILKLGIDWYRNWTTVVIVPKEFVNHRVLRDRAGVVHEWVETDAGESWQKGPVVLSWRDVEASGWCDGFNVVIHEAAHRLDMTDGSVNGRPGLHKGMDGKRWFDICSAAFSDLAGRSGSRRRSQIDAYATVSDAEFFAVVTEYFFELPHVVHREYPDLYELFRTFYRQDPLSRLHDRPVARHRL